MSETPEKGTEVEEKQEQRINELYEKKELTPEEQKEFNELKTERKNRYQKRLDKKTSEALAAKHEAELAKQRADELEKRLKEVEENKKRTVRVVEETVEIDGKHYPTDRALKSMVEAGEITDEEAWKRKDERDKEEIAYKVAEKNEQRRKQESEKETREEDLKTVLKQYPHFNKNHPDFDPEDPLYLEVNRLWNNGYKFNPRGLSESLRDARRILRINDEAPDVSDDLNLRSSTPPTGTKKDRESELSDAEKEYVVKLYSNKINPKTGRTYTADEAVAKAKIAKEAQMASRRA